MKSIARIIQTSFWQDEKVVNDFSPEDKYFFLYLLTNPHTSQLGIYKLVPKTAAFELGYSVESVLCLLERFQNKYDIVKFSKETCEVAIKNYLRYSIIKGGKPVMDCLLKEESEVQNKSLLVYIYNNICSIDNLNTTVKDYLRHLEVYININDNDNERYVNESYHESYHESSTNRKSRFIPPTVEEVDAYCIKNELTHVDPENFVDFYGSKGWMVGKNKMTNWHQAVSGWNRRAKQKGEKPFRIILPKAEAKEPRRSGFEDCPDELWNKLKDHFDANGLKWEEVNLTDQDIKWMRRKGL